MPVLRLHRIVRFHAVHHYRHSEWSEAENERVFGELGRPHGHHYAVHVTLTGETEPGTGFLVDLPALDRLLEDYIRIPLDGGDLNALIPGVARGETQPSCEVLARWIWDRLDGSLPGRVRLERVQVWESEELGAEVAAG